MNLDGPYREVLLLAQQSFLQKASLKEITGGEFRVYRASRRYIDLLQGSYNGNYPPENVLDKSWEDAALKMFERKSPPSPHIRLMIKILHYPQ